MVSLPLSWGRSGCIWTPTKKWLSCRRESKMSFLLLQHEGMGGGAVVNCIVNAVRALSHITTLKLDNQSRHLGFYRMCYSSWLKRLKNRPGFLNLRTIDILSRTILCCGGCPNHCSGWPASLPSTNQMSAYPLSIRDNQNCPRALSNVFWG